MPDLTTIGRWVFLAGVALMVLGGMLWLVGRFSLPLGRLPGDIFIQRDGSSFYFPITTMILLSLVLTVVANLIGRFFNR
ncbi:MAG: DUF2905 domain-containing protein [Anaerolineales bacterium]|nr:DUF2905 domain-containing protein [Anaerolineales bacterium]